MDERKAYLDLINKSKGRLRLALQKMVTEAEEAIGALPQDFTEALVARTVEAEAMPRQSEVELMAIFFRDGWRAAREKIGEY